jgi:hypothetical protein
MKVGQKKKKKSRILPFSWLPIGTNHNNLAIWVWISNFLIFKIWRVWVIFFPCLILCIDQNDVFQVEIWRNFF